MFKSGIKILYRASCLVLGFKNKVKGEHCEIAYFSGCLRAG